MTKSSEREPKKKHLNTIPKFLQKLKGSFGPLNFKDQEREREREREREKKEVTAIMTTWLESRNIRDSII